MARRYLWKIGGEAGFGIMTTGLLFSKIATRHGYHIFDYFEYPSLIRGGHNTTETLVSDEEVYCTKTQIDLLVCLNEATYTNHKSRLHKDSIVINDKADFEITDPAFHVINLPFKEILTAEKASMVMMNNIALGASLAIMGWDLTILNEMISQTFEKKGVDAVENNQKLAKLGFDHITNNYKDLIHNIFPQKKEQERLVLTGNDAFSLGAIVADCRLYAAYPMTPASSVLSTLAGYAEKTGMVVRHAEDELSAINTALGSSVAGVRSSVGTSGGGFALMTESVSMAGVAEIPIVMFLAQRPGPATGLPTWTEQGDLLFAVHAGHGEFPKIVLAPGDIQEMYELTAEAFDLADIYQTPVIVLSDKMVSESHNCVDAVKFKLWAKGYKRNRGKIVSSFEYGVSGEENDKGYRRYEVTTDGVSPMLIPGAPGHFYQANSYEHIEDSHTTEDAQERIKQNDKRDRKEKTYLASNFKPPTVFGDLSKAETVFVSWGSNKGAILEAMKLIKTPTAYIHFTHVYPLDEEKVRTQLPDGRNYILVENNSHAQFGRLLRQQTGITFQNKLLKYDGRPFFPEEIVSYVGQTM